MGDSLLIAPIHVKLGRADGHVGPLGCAKFHLKRHRGRECGPKNIKNFHFPRSGKLPVLNLLPGQKSGFFAPQGRLVAPIHVKLGRADRHVSPLGCAKFHLNRHRGGGNAAPKIDRFRKNLGDFIRLTMLH